MSPVRLFATVFGVIFLAELPDKTALAALVLATRLRALPVFLGTALALTLQSCVAVFAGSLFARLPERVVHVGSGMVFIGCGLWMWLHQADDDAAAKDAVEQPGFWRVLWTAFSVVFIAEWGDLTQIATVALEAKYHAWAIVLVSSALALWTVAAIAVFVGNRAAKILDPRITQRVAIVVFLLVGSLLVTGVL